MSNDQKKTGLFLMNTINRLEVVNPFSFFRIYRTTSLARGSAYMVAARLIIMVIGIVTHLINARLLGPKLYGVFSLFISVIMVLNGIETGIASSVTKYTSEFLAKAEHKKIFSVFFSALLCELFLVVLFSIGVLIIDKRTGLFEGFTAISIFLIIALMLNGYLSLVGSLIVGFKKLKEISILQVIQTTFYLIALVFLVVIFRFRLYGTLFSFIIGMVIAAGLAFIFVKNLLRNFIKKNRQLMLKKIIYFAVPVTIASSLNTIIISGGPLVFKYLTGDLLQLGYFAVLMTLGNRLRQLFLTISKSVFPYISSWHAIDDNYKIKKIVLIMTCGFLVIFFVLFLLLNIFGHNIVHLLYGNQYAPIVSYMMLAFSVYLVASYKDLLAVILNAIGKPKQNMVVMITSFFIYLGVIIVGKKYFPIITCMFAAIGISNAFYSIQALFFLRRNDII